MLNDQTMFQTDPCRSPRFVLLSSSFRYLCVCFNFTANCFETPVLAGCLNSNFLNYFNIFKLSDIYVLFVQFCAISGIKWADDGQSQFCIFLLLFLSSLQFGSACVIWKFRLFDRILFINPNLKLADIFCDSQTANNLAFRATANLILLGRIL